jgi:hypothetical protein
MHLSGYPRPKCASHNQYKAVEVTGEDSAPIKTEMTLSRWLDSHNGKVLGPPSER